MERWPLVGRSALLAELHGPRGRRRPSIVLSGPPGVGKSRLAAELGRLAARDGADVRTVLATPATQPLPRAALDQALLDSRRRAADDGDLVLVVDDGHLLDPLSATELHRLVDDGTVRAIITLRAGEPVPPPVVALWTGDHAVRVEVGPLARDDVDALVAAVLGGPVAAGTRDELWRLSLGNVLFLHELVAGARAGGGLAEGADGWEHTRPIGGIARLEDTVLARIGTLGPDARTALEYLALSGRLGFRILEKLIDEDVVGQLEDAGVLAAVEDGHRVYVRAAHPLYSEVVRHRMSRSRLRTTVRKLVAALEATGGRRREDALAMGCWLLEAGDGGDPDTLARAAAEADRRGDARLAERLARASLAAGGTGEALLALGESLRNQGRTAEAEPILAEVAERAPDGGLRARAARWLGKLRFLDATPDDGMATLARAREAAEEPWDRLLGAELALLLFYRGRYREALDLARGVVRDAGEDEPALVLGLLVAAGTGAWLGEPVAARADARRGLALGANLAPEFFPSLMAASLFANFMAGRFPRPDPPERDASAEALDFGPLAVGTFLYEGRARDAAALVDGLLDLLRAVDREGSLAIFLGFRAEAAALLGQVDHARALIAEGWDALGPHSCYEYCLQRAEVWALVADGRVLEAIDATLAVADGHAERPGLAAFALHDAVRLGAADRVADRLTSLAATLPEPGLVTTWAAQARAAADGDGAALEQAADSLAASGLRLWAAEAAAQAAAAHEATGDAPGARRAALRSEEWADACGRPATPALARRLPRLTRREEEVARLAARGLSNAEIGERLFVSARTVENHLAHVYDKLGVRGRRALAAEIGVDHS